MQLPANKQDRQKVLALIGLGVAALLYGLWAGLLKPLLNDRAALKEEIAALQNKLDKAERQIRRLPGIEKEYEEVVNELIDVAEMHILAPQAGGNYRLAAEEEVLKPQARELGIDTLQVDEIGLVAIPGGSKGSANPAVQLYAVRVSVRCSYEDLRKWFDVLHQENPLVSVGNVMITAQSGFPELHQVTFEVHFPVWIDPAYGKALLADRDEQGARKIEK